MSFDQAAVMAKLQDLLSLESSAFQRVYSQGNVDGDELPSGTLETPCALLFDGGTIDYLLTQPKAAHHYEIVCLLMASGASFGERINALIGMKQACLSRLAVNVTLGSLAVKCLFRRATRPAVHEWAGTDYTGQELIFEVEEQATVSAAPGS